MKRVVSVMVIVGFVVFALAPICLANEPSGPAMDAARKTTKYTGDVVTGSVKTVGEVAKGTTETAVSPFVSFWRFLRGKGKSTDVVTEPLNKGGQTVHGAAVSTGQTLRGKK